MFKHSNSRNLIITIIAMLGGMSLLSRNMVDPDLWGHIQYGADWIEAGEMPRTATHTYANPDHPWVNHENISELVMAIGHQYFGGLGLAIGKALLGLGVLLLIRRNSILEQVGEISASMTVVPIAYGLAASWLIRPQLASFVCFALMMVLLESVNRNRKTASTYPWRIWLIVPLIIVWTNSHGGFLAGICVFCAWLGLNGIRAVYESGWNTSKPLVFQSTAIGIAAMAAPIVNPYGAALPYWLWHSLGASRPEISEWGSVIDQPIYWFAWSVLTGLAVFSWVFTTKTRDWTKIIIFAIVTVMAFRHVRHIAFAALLAGFWLPVHLESAIRRWKKAKPTADEHSPKEAMAIHAMLGIGVLVFCAVLVAEFRHFGVRRFEYPVSAATFLNQHDLHGRMVVTFDWAQYAIAAFPESTVGFDGRFRTCYSQEVVDMHFDIILGDQKRNRDELGSGPLDPTKVLRFGDPELVLIKRVDTLANETLAKDSNWCILYRDAIAEVWGRSDRFDDPASDSFLPEEERSITDAKQEGIAAWPALPPIDNTEPSNRAFVTTQPFSLLYQ